MREVYRKVILVALLVALAFLLAHPFAHANGYDPQNPEALSEAGESVNPWEKLEDWTTGILMGLLQLLQNVSPLVIIVAAILGAGIFLTGALVGSRSLKGIGVTAVLAAFGAYLVIKNAPVIVLMIQGFGIE